MTAHPDPAKEVIAQVMKHFADKVRKPQLWKARYGHGRVPTCCRGGDGKWWVVAGGGVFRQIQGGGYNFMNFVHDYGLFVFGDPFLAAEEAKPFEDRHPAIQWMHSYIDIHQATLKSENPRSGADNVGGGAAWSRLAYDLYTISDNSKLEAQFRERLLDPKRFQGARHELRVAATCVVAGFEVKFEDEQNNKTKHPEFIATDRFSNAQLAVEAKSRHRKGVQGFEGGRSIDPGESVDIRQPIVEAYKKATSLPLYVFVDANLPPTDDSSWSRWMAEINRTMSDLSEEGYADPCPANAVFVQNDCSHYLLREQIGNGRDRLWIKHFTAKNPRIPHPATDIVDRIMKAHAQRVSPPQDFPDFQ